MIGGMLKRVFGSANDRMLNRLKGEIEAIGQERHVLDISPHQVDVDVKYPRRLPRQPNSRLG